jgi:hypothetical protein
VKVRVKNLVLEDTDIQFGVRDDPIKTGNLADPVKPGRFHGNLYITEFGITWCKGKQAKQNGKLIKWRSFIKMMEERQDA